jgi:hypothetical protein
MPASAVLATIGLTEHGMRTCYSVEQFQNQWVDSVCGTRILTCRTKKTALEVARRAMVLLHQSAPAELLGQGAFNNADNDDLFHCSGTTSQCGRQDDRCGAAAAVAKTRQG